MAATANAPDFGLEWPADDADVLRDYLKLVGVPWRKWGPPMRRPDGDLPAAARGGSGRSADHTSAADDETTDRTQVADRDESEADETDLAPGPARATGDDTPEPVEPVAPGRRSRNDTAIAVYRARPMVAVLPFENRSADQEQEYLAEAISDELLIRAVQDRLADAHLAGQHRPLQ